MSKPLVIGLMDLADVELPRLSSTEHSGGSAFAAGVDWTKPASQEYRRRTNIELRQWGEIVGEDNALEARALERYEGGRTGSQLLPKGASKKGFEIVVGATSHWQAMTKGDGFTTPLKYPPYSRGMRRSSLST
jgi:hypothetical protein